MKKKAASDLKQTTSISMTPNKRKRYAKAMKKLGVRTFNSFVEGALDSRADEALQESEQRGTPHNDKQMQALMEAVQLLTEQVELLRAELKEKCLVES